MKPKLFGAAVRAACPTCDGAITSFEVRGINPSGYIELELEHHFNEQFFHKVGYQLLRCAGCGCGGLARIHINVSGIKQLGDFYPASRDRAGLPDGTPEGVVSEYREAELCASVGAMRGASALLRSALEKTLRANGYLKGTLEKRIDEATDDRILTQARQKSAHEDVRVFGNDILHEDWRAVGPEEYEAAHRYVQRIIEDLYDQRDAVEAVLIAAGRIKPKNTEQTGESE